MNRSEKIAAGLKCCQVSMSEENPFGKCEQCPYDMEGLSVQDCRSKLSAECLDLIESLQAQLDEAMLWR